MRFLEIDTKTGFEINDPTKPVIIRDKWGRLFYSTEPSLPRIRMFNLPPGKYYVETGNFKQMQSPLKYSLIPLPGPERVYRDPFDFKIKFEPNPHKCTINFDDEVIIFDTSFLEKPLPEIYFILFHEFAHQYFKSEHLADVLASNYMLVKGFNPEQIGRAHITSLSCRQHARKRFNVERLIKISANANR